MTMSKEQIDAISNLPAPKRYSHFIISVVASKKAWGLYDDGWAMSETIDGKPSFPLWPEREYAELCIEEEWSKYIAKEISLEDLLDELIPALREDNVEPSTFYVPGIGGTTATLDEIERDLKTEIERSKERKNGRKN